MRYNDDGGQGPKPFEELTFKVIGCAMRVHNKLGPGLKEAMYQRALSLELEREDISFEAEHPVDIAIDDASIGLLYLDHLIEGAVVVEEKAVSHLMTNDEVAQVITYLCATGLSVGLLINFGRRRLEHKRIFPPKDVSRWRDHIRRYVWQPAEQPRSQDALSSTRSPQFRPTALRSPSAYPFANPLTG